MGGDPNTHFVLISEQEIAATSVYGDWIGRPVLLNDGSKWIMAYRVAWQHGNAASDRVCIRFSTDEGMTWTNENIYTDGNPVTGAPMYRETQQCADSASIVKAPNGDILIAVPHGGNDGSTHIWRSTDGGASWAEDGSMGTYNSDVVTEMLVIGTDIYATCYAGGYNCDLAKSSDNGLTWTLVSHVTVDGEGWDVNEYSLCSPEANKLLTAMRVYNNLNTLTRTSLDLGANWALLTTIKNQVGLIQRPRLRMFAGSNNIYLIGRNYIAVDNQYTCIAYSVDGGYLWYDQLNLESESQMDCGYCDMLKKSNGDFYIASYRGIFTEATIYGYVVRLVAD